MKKDWNLVVFPAATKRHERQRDALSAIVMKHYLLLTLNDKRLHFPSCNLHKGRDINNKEKGPGRNRRVMFPPAVEEYLVRFRPPCSRQSAIRRNSLITPSTILGEAYNLKERCNAKNKPFDKRKLTPKVVSLRSQNACSYPYLSYSGINKH